MTQEKRLAILIRGLLEEIPDGRKFPIPAGEAEQGRLFRSLCNLRPPRPVSDEFLSLQDAYLQEGLAQKGITDAESLAPLEDGLCVWRGDITALGADAIVNAANSQLLGCFVPCHGCIDNAIHTWAGIQLRLACAELMERQGRPEPMGRAKLTPAFNLPSRYVLHTVGPIVSGAPTQEDRETLAACYRSCLERARRQNCRSLAFCCISTGEFHFPNEPAARIAVDTVRRYRAETNSEIKVIFNVFKEFDERLYRDILGTA